MTIFMNFKNQSQRLMYYEYIWCFFITTYSIESSLHQNKMLGYFGLRSSALASKTEQQQNGQMNT